MGKKSSQKDRAYQTASEWREEGGGHKGRLQGGGQGGFKRLPFNCCAISFQPFEDPVATQDGTVMDIVNAVPYITRYKRHPVTGEPLQLKDLVPLHFHRNADGEYACPTLNKVFNENTHIVAIKTTGNVYCWDAIDQLCIKPKSMKDLITDEPFTKKDIIHIQDPLNLAKRNLAEFDHVKYDRSAWDDSNNVDTNDPMFGLNVSALPTDLKKTLAVLDTEEASKAFVEGGGGKKAQAVRALAEAKAKAKEKAASRVPEVADPRLRSDPRHQAVPSFKPGAATWNTDDQRHGGSGHISEAVGSDKDPSGGKSVPKPYSNTWVEGSTSTGASSKSFTSTMVDVSTKMERTKVLQHLKPDKKGYLRLHTSLGDLNIELHCDVVPKTCENFLALIEGRYYDDVIFHRLIKNFMIQGGDPTGTGKGGVSVFGRTFADEFDSRLVHDARGVLSMANLGPNTNGSQFFILFKSARHLDFKHTVFGRVVGGFETLTAMERVSTDDEDRPVQEVKIMGGTVFVNPYKDLLEEEKRKIEAKEKAAAAGFLEHIAVVDKNTPLASWLSGDKEGASKDGRQPAVGKYIGKATARVHVKLPEPALEVPAKKPKVTKGNRLVNFDAW